MNYSLEIGAFSHYDLSKREIAGVLLTGLAFGGVPYAIRHLQLGRNDRNKLGGHAVIACIQLLPVIGTIAALFEYIIVKGYNLWQQRKTVRFSSWQPERLDSATALRKMEHNADHAQEKFLLRNRHPENVKYFATLAEIRKEEEAKDKDSSALRYAYVTAADIGKRPTMQDGHFSEVLGQRFYIAGVFDGHGGKGNPGKKFSKRFLEKIQKIVSEEKLNAVSKDSEIPQKIRYIFEKATFLVQQQFLKDHYSQSLSSAEGSTAVVSLIDRDTAKLYTMAIGDSEAHIYRQFGSEGTTKVIVASRCFDWGSPGEQVRLKGWREDDYIGDLREGYNPKRLRSGIVFRGKKEDGDGVNCSRALGDIYYRGTADKPMVLDRPKMTVRQLKAGDDVVLCCDGVPDFVEPPELIDTVDWVRKTEFGNLAQELVDTSVRNQGPRGTDNVTALWIRVR